MLTSYRIFDTFSSDPLCLVCSGAEYRILAPVYWPLSSDNGDGVWSVPSLFVVLVRLSSVS